MHDLAQFGLSDLVRLNAALRSLTATASSMEGLADGVVRCLYNSLLDKESGRRASVLVRFYKTHRLGDLPAELRATAEESLPEGSETAPSLRCLTLLASAGDRPAWNDRRASVAHRVIPLASTESVRRSPMIERLIEQLGYEVDHVVDPSAPQMVDPGPQTFNVFYVPEAAGSPYVPAQDFVAEAGVRSVLGFGGILPGGEIFAVIVFARVPVPRDTAMLFRTVALTVTTTALLHTDRVFEGDPGAEPDPRLPEWEVAVLRQLLEVRESAVLDQTLRLEQALVELEDRAREVHRSSEMVRASEARKAAILESALDAVISIDAAGVVIEFNPAAEHMFGYPRATALGSTMSELLIPPRLRALHTAGLARYLAGGRAAILGRRIEISGLHASGHEFPVELTVTRVDLPGPPTFTAYARDLTQARRTEDELRELADTLQASLLPPTPPSIPGLELATRYLPASRGLLVGGDFFDVFPLGHEQWGLVIGDVCGKGARAATRTALARYTIRAAAAHDDSPSAVLSELNRALLAEVEGDDQFCSVVFARLAPASGSLAMVAASAGHHPPLLRRSSGEVTEVLTPGMLVGLFPDIDFPESRVDSHPGDTLVFYTDGLIEARDAGGEEFGADRLRAAIGDAAGLTAGETADALLDAVRQWGPTSDDVALLVVRTKTAR